MTKKIAVMNQKGGVGKTTIADEIAYELEARGRSVGFMNFDAQGGAVHSATVIDGTEDYVVIDTPGHMDKDFMKVASLADVVIIPTTPGREEMVPLVRSYDAARQAKDTVIGVVLNRFEENQLVDKDFLRFVQNAEMPIWGIIPKATGISQAHAMYSSVSEYLGEKSKVAQAFKSLVDKIEEA